MTLTQCHGQRSLKGSIVLFICLTKKVVHIELTTDLIIESFLDVLKIFLARGGPVYCIYSDNGTNFQSAKKLT